MKPIVALGEILWDLFPDGRQIPGGAPFNFAFHCHQLGHPAVIVSAVGEDALGRLMVDELHRYGLRSDFIQCKPSHPTGTVRVRLGPDGQPSYTITPDVAWDLLEEAPGLHELLADAGAVCFGTLAQRAPLSRETIQILLADLSHGETPPLRVLDLNIRQVDLDPEVVAFSRAHADWIKLNTAEAVEWLALNDRAGENPLQFLEREVLRNHPRSAVIWTHGREGADILAPDAHFHLPGVPACVVDTVGAGDAFTAALVCLQREGRPMLECARFALHYAARVCEHQGGTPSIDRSEIEAAVNKPQPSE